MPFFMLNTGAKLANSKQILKETNKKWKLHHELLHTCSCLKKKLIFSSCLYSKQRCLVPLFLIFLSLMIFSSTIILLFLCPASDNHLFPFALTMLSCIFLSSPAAETSGVFEPKCPSIEWPDCPCLPPLRSVQGNPHHCPAAGTFCRAWSLGTCRPRPLLWPTKTDPPCGFGFLPVCRQRWCWRWTSTTRRLCLPLGCWPEQLVQKQNIENKIRYFSSINPGGWHCICSSFNSSFQIKIFKTLTFKTTLDKVNWEITWNIFCIVQKKVPKYLNARKLILKMFKLDIWPFAQHIQIYVHLFTQWGMKVSENLCKCF